MDEEKNTATQDLKTLKLAIIIFIDMQNNMFFIENIIVKTLNKRNNKPKIKFLINPKKGNNFWR